MNCPTCAENIQEHATVCRFCGNGVSKEKFAECPYCAEMIRKSARLCRFCKSELPAGLQETPTQSSLKKSGTSQQLKDNLQALNQIDDVSNQLSEQQQTTPALNKALMEEKENRIWNILQKEFSNTNFEERGIVKERIKTLVEEESDLSEAERDALRETVLDEVFGFGPLGKFLRDQRIQDIFVNSPTEIWVERNRRYERVADTFKSNKHLFDTIKKFADAAGEDYSPKSPVLNMRLPNGTRITAAMTPIGQSLTIKCYGIPKLTLSEQVERRTLSFEMAEFLKAAIQARMNILICGPQMCGKTTLLNTLLALLPKRERVVSIEEKSELRKPEECNWVSLETQEANSQRAGLSLSMLTRTALQMKPDRVALSEAKGEELFYVASAVQTGLEGFLSTVSAASAAEALEKLTAMISTQSSNTNPQQCQRLAAQTFDLIVEMGQLPDGSRHVFRILELETNSTNGLRMQPIYQLVERGTLETGVAEIEFYPSTNEPRACETMRKRAVETKTSWFS